MARALARRDGSTAKTLVLSKDRRAAVRVPDRGGPAPRAVHRSIRPNNSARLRTEVGISSDPSSDDSPAGAEHDRHPHRGHRSWCPTVGGGHSVRGAGMGVRTCSSPCPYDAAEPGESVAVGLRVGRPRPARGCVTRRAPFAASDASGARGAAVGRPGAGVGRRDASTEPRHGDHAGGAGTAHWGAAEPACAGRGLHASDCAGAVADRAGSKGAQRAEDSAFDQDRAASPDRGRGPFVSCRRIPPGEDGTLFTTRFGAPYAHAYYGTRIFAAAVDRAGVPPSTTSHDLRHHYASVLLAQGESVVAVAERLGHHNAALVLSTYGHLMPDSEDRTRRAVDSAWAARAPSVPHAEGAGP